MDKNEDDLVGRPFQLPLWDAQEIRPTNVTKIRVAAFDYLARVKQETSLSNQLPEKEAEFLRNNSNAFLFGLIADQSVRVEMAWALPFHLAERANHFDVYQFSLMPINDLEDLLRSPKPLHRYPNKMADYIVHSCRRLVDEWAGDAARIWKHPAPASSIIAELRKFKGIGRKKAALGVMLLIRDFGLDISDTESIDIAYDIHIRRVFLRSGLVQIDTHDAVSEAARNLHAIYPGLLTTPFWMIGRKWCRPQNPLCGLCAINEGCAKQVTLGTDIYA